MPAVSHPKATADILHDPYGFDQVSGFYGPGTWAGWVIAVTSTWLAILKGTHKLNYDLIGHLLYTNWAAIDLIRQLRSDDPLIGPTAAAIVVSYWGMVHGFFQHFVLGIDDLHYHVRDDGDTDVAWVVYAVARIVPVLALSGAVFHLMDEKALIWAHAPEAMDTAAMIANFKNAFAWAFAVAGILFFFMYIKACFGHNLVVAAVVVGCTVLPVFCMLAYCIVFWGFLFGAKEPDCWFFKPCTAQSIAEGEQTFALLCALVYFVREIGPDMYSVMVHRHWVALTSVQDGAE
ncbi:hypothetical protein IQ06DRAFT_296936 [Phaeosphaeriaceae sp. SRC1lsM3a]|nr:hypothetical protein IQ06DRAFT_296936 [Stagonospora sp. SRC1lsM3a]